MRLTLNAHGLVKLYGDARAAELAKAAGFDAVDYDICVMEKDTSDVWHSEGYVDEAKRIRAIFENAGVPIVQTHAPFRFTNWTDREYFEGFIMPTMKLSVEVSALLGAKVVVAHPLHFMKYAGNEEEIFEMNMKYYSELAEVAKKFDIKVAVENMFQWDDFRNLPAHDTCSTSKEFIRYIDTLDNENIVACLDVGHVGLPRPDGEEAWDLVRALGHDRLKSLHIHDNDYKNDQHLMPYSGRIDWDKVTEALGEIDYDGDFTYEVNTYYRIKRVGDDFALPELKYMADIGKHLIGKIEKNRKK